MNSVTLIGNVGTAPERINFENGTSIVRFSLATNAKWKDKKSGEMQERVEWHSIVVGIQGMTDTAEKHITKGMKLAVRGEIRYTKKDNADNTTSYFTHINCQRFEFLGKPTGSAATPDESFVQGGTAAPGSSPAETFVAEGDDDMPF